MSNTLVFVGRLSAAPSLKNSGKKAVAKLVLIRNEYAGTDNEGETKERTVSAQFTAFGGMAETLAKNAMKGDQLIVTARVQNNNYEKDGEKVYGFDFVIEGFEYGAPGPEKREQLANR